MPDGELLRAVLEVVEALDALGVPYHVGGSLASSVHGIPRQTNDLDLVVDLPTAAVAPLEERLRGNFYVDAESIRRAIRQRRSFNLVHLATGFKIDVFLQGRSPFDRMEFARLGRHRLEDLPRELAVKSAEDTVLRKLEWYRLGTEVSDRQWSDVLGVIRTQGDRLDVDYLRRWAPELGVADLLERALQAATGGPAGE